MKAISLLMLTSLLFLGFMCEGSSPVVGSDQDVQINSLAFAITSTSLSGQTMYASGTVRNYGSTKVSSPWYVEGQFYADSTYALKLGGDNTQINVPLDPGQSTIWNLSFTLPQGSAQNYPAFKVRDLRGIYRK